MSANEEAAQFATPAAIADGVHADLPGAETALAKMFGPRLVSIIKRRGASPQLAEDLSQEALIVVLKRLRERELDNPDQLAGFIHQTSKNLWINELRKRERRQTAADSDQIDRAVDSSTPTPEATVDQLERRRLLRDLIDALPNVRDRKILQLFYIDGLPKSQVCEQLALTPRQFDQVISRARQRLVRAANADGQDS
ncbi:MAG: sigma-70 family RNA polymerase sigma factor [Pseudomonadota bacterium]